MLTAKFVCGYKDKIRIYLGFMLVQKSGSSRFSINIRDQISPLAGRLVSSIKQKFLLAQQALSPLRKILVTINVSVHCCTFMDILPCWLLLQFAEVSAGQHCLPSFLGSLHNTFWYWGMHRYQGTVGKKRFFGQNHLEKSKSCVLSVLCLQ